MKAGSGATGPFLVFTKESGTEPGNSQSPEWKLRWIESVSTDTGSVCSTLKFYRQGSNRKGRKEKNVPFDPVYSIVRF